MRLDTDSSILEPMCYDPFERMHSRGLSYAYVADSEDEPYLVQGLWKLVDSYALGSRGIEKRMKVNGFLWPEDRSVLEMENVPFPYFYNNFEIVRLERFRQPDIRRWLNEVASVPERFYKYRWGTSNYSSLCRPRS
jgi:mannosyltransferase